MSFVSRYLSYQHHTRFEVKLVFKSDIVVWVLDCGRLHHYINSVVSTLSLLKLCSNQILPFPPLHTLFLSPLFALSVKMANEEPVFYNVKEWIEENRSQFQPPVCNKMMHNEGQMKAFFVGGPNQRKDYHIEEGEELFFMLRGDMCLKVIEHGEFKDIPICEGEIFRLPARIAHSPQRLANTIGMVLERERMKEPLELDGLRYHVEVDGQPTHESLYEAWFYCSDLGKELAPIINGFFASEQYKTGRPLPGTIPDNPPIQLDSVTTLQRPFSLRQWIADHRETIDTDGKEVMFGGATSQLQVEVHGLGSSELQCDSAEIWLWQLDGEATATVDGKSYSLSKYDSLLIPVGKKCATTRPSGGVTLVCYQDAGRRRH